MADQNSQYMAILTAVGEAKQANANALGVPWLITEMGVGDANGAEPQPDRLQTGLINERRRAPLNQLSVDPNNAAIIIAEQVIPENIGGWWIREIGLYDEDGDLVAVANCPPTFKPELSQGSGRTQVVRLNIIVSSTQNIQLKIDPAVVLATRQYVDNKLSVYAPLASPSFTGNPTAPTRPWGDNTGALATTEHVFAAMRDGISLYVSPTGSDDNDGLSDATPLRTIERAIYLIPGGGNGNVYLAPGTYVLEESTSIANKSVRLQSTTGVKTDVVIMNRAFERFVNNGHYVTTTGFLLFSARLIFFHVTVKTAHAIASSLPLAPQYSFISRTDFGLGAVFFHMCDIELNDAPLFRPASGGTFIDLAFYLSTITRPGTGLVATDMVTSVMRLHVATLTLPSGRTLAQLINGIVRASDNVPINILSNASLLS